jgi:hypothetical protein
MAPQAQTQTAQNTAQGDAATPLETGVRQLGDAEKQRAAEAKAAREAALAKLNKERRQKRLRDAQELNECLGSGMDLLTPEQVGQITEAAPAAGNEPMDALRSFGERLRNLRDKNPHASEVDLREAVKGAMQVMITRSREQGGPARISPDPLPAECCRERNPRWSRCTATSVASGSTCTRRSGTADLIRSYRRALHSGIASAQETANREADARGWDPDAVDGMLQEVEESTATLFPAAEQVLQELEEEFGKKEQSTMLRRSPT